MIDLLPSLLTFPLAIIGTGAALLASAAIGAGTSIYAANQNKKALNAAMANQKTVDVGKLAEDARTNAETNLKNAIAMEKQYLPGQAALRDVTTQNFLDQLSPTGTAAQQRQAALERALGFTPTTPDITYGGNALAQSAADSILADLALGGSLDPETQAAVVRAGLATTGRSGILGSNAGRGLVARDLGLTSLQLKQARQNAALQAGLAQSQLGLSKAGLDLQAQQQYLASLGLGLDATSGNLVNAGNLYGLLASQPYPDVGLSSGDLASVTVGQTNAANQNALTAAGIQASNNSSMAGGIANALQSGLGLYAQMGGGLGGASYPNMPLTPGAGGTTIVPNYQGTGGTLTIGPIR